MASSPTSPDTNDRDEPGDTQTNPGGVSTDQPAEGGDDTPGKNSGSPQG